GSRASAVLIGRTPFPSDPTGLFCSEILREQNEGSHRIHDMEIHNIGRLIYVLRGQRVMLDYDLAAIYDTEVLQLKRQVRRNLERFPHDFMLTFTRAEYESLRCQIGILKRDQYRDHARVRSSEKRACRK
ncbi:MAG: ORF6N domain-containing protein, partial [Elusimicrobiota bacterium]